MRSSSDHLLVDSDRRLFWVITCALYCLAYGWVFTYPGIFWDDWQLLGNRPEVIHHAFISASRPFFALLHGFLFSLPAAMWVYKAVTFVSFFGTALALDGLISRLATKVEWLRLDEFSRRLLIWAALFSPIFVERDYLMAAHYPLVLLGSLIAFRLFVSDSTALRWGSAPLFLACFSLEAVLILYAALIPLLLLIRRGWRIWPVNPRWVMETALWMLLPVFYWWARKEFFTPTGSLEGLNTIGLRWLAFSPWNFLKSSLACAQAVILLVFREGPWLCVVVALVLAFLYRWCFGKAESGAGASLKNNLYLIGAGVALAYLGELAFLAVGKIPEYSDWSSRYQTFALPGVALALAAILSWGARKESKIGVVCVIGVFSIFLTHAAISRGIFLSDWNRQDSLMRIWSRSLTKSDSAKGFTIQDFARRLNAFGRIPRFYEYTGMITRARGDCGSSFAEDMRTHIGVVSGVAKQLGDPLTRGLFRMDCFEVRENQDFIFILERNSARYRPLDVLGLRVRAWFGAADWDKEVDHWVESYSANIRGFTLEGGQLHRQ